MIEESFGEKIKSLREAKNLTLREVASSVNIGTSMLGKIEKNSRKPTRELIEKFSKYFNVTAKELTVAFVSDAVVYEVLEDQSFAQEILKAAEKKVKYLKSKNSVVR